METHNKQVLKHLKSGRNLTALEALGNFGCMRLAARIKDLKDAGHKIDKIMVKIRGRHVARYFMKGAK